MTELSINEVESAIAATRGREVYERQDIRAMEIKESEDFISERADIRWIVKQLHEKYYSRYLPDEKPKIEVIA